MAELECGVAGAAGDYSQISDCISAKTVLLAACNVHDGISALPD